MDGELETLHLSTLGGLHVIPAEEYRGTGRDVMQATIQGRWESPGVFLTATPERLIVAEGGSRKWASATGPG